MTRRFFQQRRSALFLPAFLNLFFLCSSVAQSPEIDYSKFLHSSAKHRSVACTSCHERSDNSATPRFPGHKACTDCHRGQFTTPAIPMCLICHTDTKSNNPPLKNFPASFNEAFNMKFDHAQHNAGTGRPPNGCAGCHSSPVNRRAGFSIPANLAAHNNCYTCHTPSSRSNAGREMASCGVCHDQKPYRPTSTNARAFARAFSHADHGARQRLDCADCHKVTAGAPQTRQVSSTTAAQHFNTRGQTCATCHTGKRTFGGDLGFDVCKRCHSGPTFRMPM